MARCFVMTSLGLLKMWLPHSNYIRESVIQTEYELNATDFARKFLENGAA